MPSSFDNDLAAYRKAGVEGIGICEIKLQDRDREQVASLRESGLQATFCIPTVASVLPGPLTSGPIDPDERVEALCAGIRRLAKFQPLACLCLTGPAGTYSEAAARRRIVEGLRRAAETAAQVGVKLGVEPVHPSYCAEWSIVTTIAETLDLLDEVSASNAGVSFDMFHLWDSPGLLEDIRRHADGFVGVHVADRREKTRSLWDRALPGEGVVDLPRILAALEAGGYDSWYDLEIFSDDGRYGTAYPDSLWSLPHEEMLARARRSFDRAWTQARERVLERGRR
jgi:sugar phosphate isomerase/epimerase